MHIERMVTTDLYYTYTYKTAFMKLKPHSLATFKDSTSTAGLNRPGNSLEW